MRFYKAWQESFQSENKKEDKAGVGGSSLNDFQDQQCPTTFKEDLEQLCSMLNLPESTDDEKIIEKLIEDFESGKIDIHQISVNLFKRFRTNNNEFISGGNGSGDEGYVVEGAPPREQQLDIVQEPNSSPASNGSSGVPSSNASPSSGFTSIARSVRRRYRQLELENESDSGNDTIPDNESSSDIESEMRVDKYQRDVIEDYYLDFLVRCYEQTTNGYLLGSLNPEGEFLHHVQAIAQINRMLDDEVERMEEGE